MDRSVNNFFAPFLAGNAVTGSADITNELLEAIATLISRIVAEHIDPNECAEVAALVVLASAHGFALKPHAELPPLQRATSGSQ